MIGIQMGNDDEIVEPGVAELTRIYHAEKAVIRAAKAWVNFEDDGLAATSHLQYEFNSRLVKAVMRMEKAEAAYKKAKRKAAKR